MHSSQAVVLLSGGLDSSTTLAFAKAQGYTCYALTIDYGQRHCAELQAASHVAKSLGVVEHKLLQLNLEHIGGSALTDSKIPVPITGVTHVVPVTYVPARNTIFLALALGWAEVLGINDLFIGVNAIDYSNYPDCRPQFITAFETLANLATRRGTEGHRFKIHAPLINLSKAQIIQKGLHLGLDFSLTVSCYQLTPEGYACGLCDACRLRAEGFRSLGIADPTRYMT